MLNSNALDVLRSPVAEARSTGGRALALLFGLCAVIALGSLVIALAPYVGGKGTLSSSQSRMLEIAPSRSIVGAPIAPGSTTAGTQEYARPPRAGGIDLPTSSGIARLPVAATVPESGMPQRTGEPAWKLSAFTGSNDYWGVSPANDRATENFASQPSYLGAQFAQESIPGDLDVRTNAPIGQLAGSADAGATARQPSPELPTAFGPLKLTVSGNEWRLGMEFRGGNQAAVIYPLWTPLQDFGFEPTGGVAIRTPRGLEVGGTTYGLHAFQSVVTRSARLFAGVTSHGPVVGAQFPNGDVTGSLSFLVSGGQLRAAATVALPHRGLRLSYTQSPNGDSLVWLSYTPLGGPPATRPSVTNGTWTRPTPPYPGYPTPPAPDPLTSAN